MTHRTATFKAREFSVPPAGMGVSFATEAEEAPLDGPEESEGTTEETTEEVAAEDTASEVTETAEEPAEAGTEESATDTADVADTEYPEGDPSSTWRVGQIDAWAAAQNPAVEFPEGATRLQKLAQIKELLKEGSEADV